MKVCTIAARGTASKWFSILSWLQGIYYFSTGLWPIVDVGSFQRVTGRKTDNLVTGSEADHWLLMTVSVLILAVSVPLIVAAYRKTVLLEVAMLGILAATGLCAIDLIYTARRVIAPIYLLDAALEIPMIVGWLMILIMLRRHHHERLEQRKFEDLREATTFTE